MKDLKIQYFGRDGRSIFFSDKHLIWYETDDDADFPGKEEISFSYIRALRTSVGTYNAS